MGSSVYVDNKNKDILILVKDPTFIKYIFFTTMAFFGCNIFNVCFSE